MHYHQLNDILLQNFPSLSNHIKEEYLFYGSLEPGPHTLYSSVLNPFVKELLTSSKRRDAEIRKVFAFYEELALSEDSDVQDLLQVTLLEALWENRHLYNSACEHMLPKTREINERICEYLDIPKV